MVAPRLASHGTSPHSLRAPLGRVHSRGSPHIQFVAVILGAGSRHGGILLGLLPDRGAPDRFNRDDDPRDPRGLPLRAAVFPRGAAPDRERAALQRGSCGRFIGGRGTKK